MELALAKNNCKSFMYVVTLPDEGLQIIRSQLCKNLSLR
jgi:hypothetical protein